MGDPISQQQVHDFAVAWYLALDQHAPIEQCYKMLAEDGLIMKFPDGDIHDFASFKTWYDRVTHLFFDENHNVQSVEATIEGDRARARVVVGWQASWFEPPAAKSKRTAMDATQDWVVRRTTRNEWGLEMVFYNATAEPFTYAPGFARL
jgi:spermidine synthase